MPKPPGTLADYAEDRLEELLKIYRAIVKSSRVIPQGTRLFAMIANHPTSRFWVSEVRAASVIGKLKRNESLGGMRPLKREMFTEIYRRYLAVEKQHPDWAMIDIIGHVLIQPAPKFYISPSSAKVYISMARRNKRGHMLGRLKKLRDEIPGT